ncbi:MAG: ornithine carbamoyltransferase [Burkholderiales bacterium]|nr:ornithine carbamoyltransferase [Burkholderiales bacterium]
MKLISISDLSASDIHAIWALASGPAVQRSGVAAWSFEGNGIRTRTTFIQAFRDLGLAYTELPNLLKSSERACDLAGYLDPFYDLYVIRESDHLRLAEFAAASRRPVINAMSGAGHPCEVLADAFYVHTQVAPLESLRIGLWGPPTNVLNSWHELARVLGLTLHHFCAGQSPEAPVDLLITDGWPAGFTDSSWTLSREHMARLGNPKLLPTPPFTIGNELGFDPVGFAGFLGYGQKQALVAVQRAIVMHVA